MLQTERMCRRTFLGACIIIRTANEQNVTRARNRVHARHSRTPERTDGWNTRVATTIINSGGEMRELPRVPPLLRARIWICTCTRIVAENTLGRSAKRCSARYYRVITVFRFSVARTLHSSQYTIASFYWLLVCCSAAVQSHLAMSVARVRMIICYNARSDIADQCDATPRKRTKTAQNAKRMFAISYAGHYAEVLSARWRWRSFSSCMRHATDERSFESMAGRSCYVSR